MADSGSPEPSPGGVEPVSPRPPLAELYRESFAEMVRLAHLLTGCPATAEDLVQESFVRLHQHWAGVERPGPYLRRTVVNACRSHHRRRGRERTRGGARVESVELGADELVDALAGLPYRQHAALVLRFYHDLSDTDIADALGCRPGTVGSLIHRGLLGLRKVIEP